MNRNLDDNYFSIYRNGRRQSICLPDMTIDELKTILPGVPAIDLMHCIINLCDALRSVASQLDMAKNR